MTAIDSLTVVKAAGLGLLLAAVNPKNLLMVRRRGTTIAGGALSTGENVWSVLIFTVLAASSVAVPVVGYAVGRKRIAGPLESLRGWLSTHNAAVMATLLLVIGVVLIGKGAERAAVTRRSSSPLLLGSPKAYQVGWLRADLVAGQRSARWSTPIRRPTPPSPACQPGPYTAGRRWCSGPPGVVAAPGRGPHVGDRGCPSASSAACRQRQLRRTDVGSDGGGRLTSPLQGEA